VFGLRWLVFSFMLATPHLLFEVVLVLSFPVGRVLGFGIRMLLETLLFWKSVTLIFERSTAKGLGLGIRVLL
jgi:hypothetical protein